MKTKKLISKDMAVLVSLNVSRWEANAMDRGASDEMAVNKGIKEKGMLRVWKSLLPRNEFYQAITGVVTAARKFHYANTFPWVNDGSRLLPTKNFLEYMSYMRSAKDRFELAVDKFIAEYDNLKQMAASSLNGQPSGGPNGAMRGLFREEDYPKAEELRRRFSFNTVVMPVPAGTEFSAEVPAEERDRIRSEIESSVQDCFQKANLDAWDQLRSMMLTMQQLLRDPKGMRGASLRKLQDGLALLDRLNVTGDANLERIRKDAEAQIAGLTLDSLKANDGAQAKNVAQKAAEIEQSMAMFMWGTPDGQ